MDEYIISYDSGYPNWYVSDFYKFFHKKIQEKTNVKFVYVPISELKLRYTNIKNHNSDGLFNWFNLIILNKRTQKFFVHSWYDYAPVTMDWCVQNNFNIVKFSCVSNLTDEYIKKYSFAQPSVYYLENWSDHSSIKKYENNSKTNNKIYFAALAHGVREHIMNTLKRFNGFEIYSKRDPKEFREKEKYYNELSSHKYGLSLNGAANICYRDLELFGLNVLNIREKLKSNTYNPIIPNVHYLELIDDSFLKKIKNNHNIENEIKEKIEFIEGFYNSKNYNEMIGNSKKWYLDNCLPENQFNILFSFLNELEILN